LARAFKAGLASVLIAFSLLYCGAVGPYWKLTADSTTYVRGAQSLAAGEGYLEDGQPATLFPPGTSALLAPAWVLGGGSFRVLNAEATLFAFASLIVCFLLFRISLGTIGSGVLVLLCLGCTTFFDAGTFLLSEMFYVFFSVLAFWCHQRGSKTGTILSALAAVMIRTVGITLAVAFFIDSLRKRPRRWSRTAAYLLPLVWATLWELRNMRRGWSYTRLMLQSEPWAHTSGYVSPAAMLSRLVRNLAYGRALENALTNNVTQHISWAILLGIVSGVIGFIGLRRLFLNGLSALVIYMVLFAVAVALYWPSVVGRLLMPLLPFAFACVVAGVQDVAQRTAPQWVYAVAGVLASLYLLIGFRAEVFSARDQHRSPFPACVVKYPENYGLQRIALWWKHTSLEADVYACRQANIIEAITDRTGVHYEWTGQIAALENELRSKHARFLFLDFRFAADRRLAGLLEQNDRFRLIRQDDLAGLYELVN
jgi:hypothetical protein